MDENTEVKIRERASSKDDTALILKHSINPEDGKEIEFVNEY